MPDQDSFYAPQAGPALYEELEDESEPSLESSISSLTSASALDGALRELRPFRPAGSLEGRSLAGGRIQVGRRIGGGAMGTVYEAVCDGRELAIKVLNRLQKLQVYRLKTEFRRLSQLNHPNVVCAYELFNEDQEWFFSMERVQGLPLHRYLEARSFSGVDDGYDCEFRPLLRQLVEGIAAIHGAGLVHRDIKPTNVLVANDGRLVIVDFGLVSEQAAGGVGQTIDNLVSGTIGYIAPEVLLGGPATPAIECYALGATLHQLLTGKVPRARTSVEPGSTALSWSLVGASSLPADLVAICESLLAPRPAERASVQELLELSHAWTKPPQRPSNPSGPPAEQFVGREKELEVIRDAYTRARDGIVSMVLVHGASGSGKTALLGHWVAQMRAEGVIVLEGRCSEWEWVPYKGLDEVVDSLSRLMLKMPADQAAYLVPRHAAAVVRVFPALLRIEAFAEAARADPSEAEEPRLLRLRAVAGMKDTFYRLAERYRVVIAIDDLQWVDADTIQLLADLLSPPAPPNLFLLASITDHVSANELVRELSGAAEVTPLALGPLDPQDSQKLTLALLQDRARNEPGVLERVVRESHGIPLYIAEFAREFADMPGGSQPVLLSQVLLARVERLDPAARKLLELVAIAVRPLTMRLAADCEAEDVQSSFRQLMAHRLVSSLSLGGQELGFKPYTEHVRQVVTQSMSEAAISERHARLVSALELLSDAEPEWLLAHYRGAGRYEAAKRYCIIVAERALRVLAFEQGASMYMAALELTPEQSTEWVELNVNCADALGKAGRGGEAARAYVRAARAAPRAQAILLMNLAVTHWIRSGHLVEGVRLLRTTLETAGVAWPETSAQAIVTLLSQRAAIRLGGLECTLRPEAEVPAELLAKLDALSPAQTALGTFDYLRGAVFAAIALRLALKAREPKRLVVALATEAIYVAMLNGLGGERRALGVQSQLDAVREHGTGAYERAASRIARSMCAYWVGRWKDVLTPAMQAEAILRKLPSGALWELSLLRSIRHTVLLHAGRQHEIAKELPDELGYASVRDDRYASLDLLRRSISIHLARDAGADALSALERLAEQRREHPFLALDHLIMSSVVATHLYAGDVERAQSELSQRWAVCRRAGMDRLALVRLTVIGMKSDCVMADERTSAAARAQQLGQLGRAAGKEKIAWAPALRSALLGSAAALVGRRGEAAMHQRSAADGFAATGLHAAAAAAEWRLARNLDPELASDDAAAPDSSDPQFSTERPENFLRAAGIVRPERWMRIVHSLY